MLAAWVRERCPAAAWVGCEALDSDPVVFWGHVGIAFREAQGDRWLDVVELLGEPDPDLVMVVDTVYAGWRTSRPSSCSTTSTSPATPDR